MFSIFLFIYCHLYCDVIMHVFCVFLNKYEYEYEYNYVPMTLQLK